MLKVFAHHVQLSTVAELLADAVLCFFAALLASRGLTGGGYAMAGVGLAMPAIVFALGMSLLYSFFGLYRRGAVSVGLAAMLGRSLLAVTMGSFIAYLAIRPANSADRVEHGVWQLLLIVAVGAVVVRSLVFVARRASLGARRVLIVGTGLEAQSVASDLRAAGSAQTSIVGFYPTGSEPHAEARGLKLLPTDVSIDEIARKMRVHEVIVAVREQRGGGVPMDQLLACRLRGIPVLDLAAFYERSRGEVPADSLKASWLVYGHGFVQGPLRKAGKRALDILASSILVAIAAPIMLLTALAIRLESRGPVIYRQERVGLGGRSFMCLKFRSMRTDAEKDGVARWATKNDSRVTRVGAFIRKTRIDELPQLLSVLKGEMSMVGPRPERPSFVGQLKEQIPFYELRHSVKPGVTGWAQVRYSYGASVEDARKKHQFDLYYVKNNSLFLDLLVLIETVSVVLFREGAH
jgi:sugar transferase (PEP-CTERM system associated)